VLSVTSLQAPIADPFCRRLTSYLSERLGRSMRFVDDEPWQVRERRLDDGEIDVAWLCGLPYVIRRDRPGPTVALLAAPVMDQKRYEDRPIYFSDVVVLRDRPWRTLADLSGTRWAYNESTSHSGYCLTRYELASAGHGSGFFANAVKAGSHQVALELLLRGEVDATALDSTVLEAMSLLRPELQEELRVIATWGPSPIPPWIVSSHVPEDTRARLQEAFTSMHRDEVGREVLREAQIARFTSVEDTDYDAIRQMARIAQDVTL
jgi:phosphonate transport system substrate-binding protein